MALQVLEAVLSSCDPNTHEDYMKEVGYFLDFSQARHMLWYSKEQSKREHLNQVIDVIDMNLITFFTFLS